jgi:glycosyltransferase involved in cell wall biosynthesis
LKVLFITTISSTFNAFLTSHAKLFKKLGYEVYLACNNTGGVINYEFLSSQKHFYNLPFSRNPLSLKNLVAMKQLNSIFNYHKFNLIYTHTPNASFYSRIALLFKKTRFLYFVHGFHFHKKSTIFSWLIFFPLELVMSIFTYAVITINREDFLIASKFFFYRKVFHLNGVGLDINEFNKVDNFTFNTICSVGELNSNKNHITIIKTFIKYPELKKYKYFIAGQGKYYDTFNSLIKKYKLKNIQLYGFQSNIDTFLNQCTLLIHPSKREGLSVAPLEAMAKGIPIITSNIRGLNDYNDNMKTGLYLTKSLKSIKDSIEKIFSNKDLYYYLSYNSRNKANLYSVNNVILKLEKIIISIRSSN